MSTRHVDKMMYTVSMNDVEHYKQLDDLVIAELNIKEIHRPIATTDKGKLELVYIGGLREYCWELDGDEVFHPTPKLDGKILEILKNNYASTS